MLYKLVNVLYKREVYSLQTTTSFLRLFSVIGIRMYKNYIHCILLFFAKCIFVLCNSAIRCIFAAEKRTPQYRLTY